MTRFLLGVAVLCAVLLAACTSDTDTPEGVAGDGCDAALDAWAEAGFSGVVVVAAAGEPVCEAGYGAADRVSGRPNAPDTVFAIGSVTKAFTAAAVFDLADSGALSPDDRVGDLLPELRGPVRDATLVQLMTHSSGLTGSPGADHQPLSRDEALAAIGAMEPAFAPGTDYAYSNAAYTLLALVVEEVAGSYREHAATRILDGLASAGFWDGEPATTGDRAVGYLDDGSTGEAGDFAGPHWALDGNGGLAMSMPDLAAWTHALFTGGVVSAESAQDIATPQVDLGDGAAETPGWVAYDASAYGVPFLAASGGGGDVGHDTVVVWVPEGERVVAVASNGPGVSAEELLAAAGPALVAGDPVPAPDVAGGTVDPEAAAAIVGDYRLDTGGAYHVTHDDDGLRIAARGADAVGALFPPGDDEASDAVRAHERLVAALLAGETDAGRDELAALDDEFGPIGGAEPAGTIVAGGELRTYVTLDTGEGPLLAWYALDEKGGVGAAEVGAEPPALTLVPDGDGFRPDDPAASGPDVTVTFDVDTVTLTGAGGATTARRS